jgi:outer membrane murein-binding lipoprotein Lpp
MRTLLLPVLALGLIAASAAVPASAAEAAKPRFSLDASRDGFVRLDTATGAVTHCTAVKGKWTCDEVLAGGAVLSARIDALSLEVSRLSAATAALDARVTRIGAADVAASTAVAPAKAPAVAQPAHRSVAGAIVTRFLAMVRLLKHGRDASTPAATRS